ncbi:MULTISPECIES: HD domain-containing protein [unclassified Catenibacterium]|uniref:HD domain-containing protein n=1 Tax=unclassified Catenibacterium TaxID=2643636 RepID=UPI00101EE017|nr:MULTISPECIES: HD domain-containing protein [unclassified Catenibacterium]MEE0820740.1 HD domain-containing protein [Catenibacterium sp.]MZT11496.1 HD domain-containing protein [Catenibacterium sp. BIOML-A1]RYT51672.1 HD domain-containing protein [Catenibacterium sp. co_0103]
MHLEDYRLFDTKVFRDVVHDYIRVEYMPIWKLINTKEFQRLRRIKQLGGTSMVFPSAEHSRFVHSLGVYEITRQMTELDQVKNHLTDYERLTVLCAALLHDLGHGPFSHSFEGIFHYNHEEMTTALIRGHTEVHEVLSQVDPHLPEDVARIIEKKADKPMLVQMISSQVDADRMDYLLRDSYNCGVTYGQFDLSRILRTMRIVDNRIVFKSSGVQAIEDYILARYYMYWQVYYHPVSRSYEQVLGSVMKRVKDLYKQNYTFKSSFPLLVPFLEDSFTPEQFVRLDETSLLYYIRCFMDEDDTILKDLSTRLLERELFKYRTLKGDEDYENTRKICIEEGLDPRYYVTSDAIMNQVPYKRMEVRHANEVEILKQDGTISSLPEESEIVQAILLGKAKQDQKIFSTRQVIRRSSFRYQSFNKYKDAQGTHYILEQASKEWNQEGLFLEFYQEDHVIGCAHIIDDCVKDIVLLPDDRREFYEKEVLGAIEEFFKKQHMCVVKIIPYSQSLDFYLENGYRTEGYYIIKEVG